MNYSFSFIVKNQSETKLAGKLITQFAESGSVLALIGNLGAGKTVFTKGVAEGLETEEPNSPTFVIMKAYEGRMPLYHFDVYRLGNQSEFEEIGFEEFIYGEGISVIEWADKIQDVLPDSTVIIEISNFDEKGKKSRKIEVKGKQKWLLSYKNTVEQAFQILRK
ncbi:MAG: tRNA (adenosine(37)-N6)-threonylcarbamoyltransferase complex ATPase subunit type 1 TsaE [Thermodesulfobacteriota bacterium]